MQKSKYFILMKAICLFPTDSLFSREGRREEEERKRGGDGQRGGDFSFRNR